MKNLRKVISALLALSLVFALSVTAFADETVAAATGSITIQGTGAVTTNGKTFNVYKILDLAVNADKTAYAYTVPEALRNFYAGLVSTEENKVTADAANLDGLAYEYISEKSKDSAALFAFAKAALDAAKAANISPVSGTGTGSDVVISGLSLGYYVIEDAGTAKPVSALMLATADVGTTVTLKANPPTLDKSVTGPNETQRESIDAITAQVGKVLTFTLDSIIPDTRGYTSYTYTFTDTMSKGLTFNADSVKVTIAGQEQTNTEGKTLYTVNSKKNDDGTTSITIDFPSFITNYGNVTIGSAVKITYTATVNADALEVDVENNEAKLTYSVDPYDVDEKGELTDKVYVFNCDIIIDKYIDGKLVEGTQEPDKSHKLSGAEFVLYKEVTVDNTTTKKYYKYDTATNAVTWVDEQSAADVVVTDTNGKATFKGLEAGKYFLLETKAPSGYNLLTEAVEVIITVEYNEDGSLKSTSAKNVNRGQYYQTAEVANKTGTLLPSTGGMGTTIFYVLGSILMIGAAVILVTKRRVGEN